MPKMNFEAKLQIVHRFHLSYLKSLFKVQASVLCCKYYLQGLRVKSTCSPLSPSRLIQPYHASRTQFFHLTQFTFIFTSLDIRSLLDLRNRE